MRKNTLQRFQAGNIQNMLYMRKIPYNVFRQVNIGDFEYTCGNIHTHIHTFTLIRSHSYSHSHIHIQCFHSHDFFHNAPMTGFKWITFSVVGLFISSLLGQPCLCDWSYIRVKEPVPIIEKSRTSCPGGRCPPSFIHRVIITTGLNE